MRVVFFGFLFLLVNTCNVYAATSTSKCFRSPKCRFAALLLCTPLVVVIMTYYYYVVVVVVHQYNYARFTCTYVCIIR